MNAQVQPLVAVKFTNVTLVGSLSVRVTGPLAFAVPTLEMVIV